MLTMKVRDLEINLDQSNDRLYHAEVAVNKLEQYSNLKKSND